MPKTQKPKTNAELVYDFALGTEEHRHASMVAQSANFVVFKIAGHSSWSGVACPWEYVKTQHILIRKGDHWLSDKPQRRWEGRVSVQVLKEALRRSELTKAVYTGDVNAPFCQECDVEMNYGEGYDGNKLVRYYRCDECGWSVDEE